MDRELIERLAMEAGIRDSYNDQPGPAALERFAALVAEECAKLCDQNQKRFGIEAVLGKAIREEFKL